MDDEKHTKYTHKVSTLSSNTTVTKEIFITLKVSILKNSALYHLKAYNLPFIHAKFRSTGSNGLATTPF